LVVSNCTTAPPQQHAAVVHFHGVPGPEDIEIQSTGPGAPRLIISSQERREKLPKEPGRLYSLSLEKGVAAAPVKLELGRDDCSFHPHGISLVTMENGLQRLYVINHHASSDVSGCLRNSKNAAQPGNPPLVHSVEVYELQNDGAWRMRERLPDPNGFLTHPNDVAALLNGFVYVTNAPSSQLGFVYEALIGHSSSSVVVFDGKEWHRVLIKPRIANGIAADWERRRLYVAETGTKRIDVLALDRGGATAPEKIGEVNIGSGVDNLSWGPPTPERRTLWVAADPSLIAFARLGSAYSRNKNALSPSEVYSIKFQGDIGTPTREFCDDGSTISGASAAIPYDGNLFISQVFYDFVLRVPLGYGTTKTQKGRKQ